MLHDRKRRTVSTVRCSSIFALRSKLDERLEFFIHKIIFSKDYSLFTDGEIEKTDIVSSPLQLCRGSGAGPVGSAMARPTFWPNKEKNLKERRGKRKIEKKKS